MKSITIINIIDNLHVIENFILTREMSEMYFYEYLFCTKVRRILLLSVDFMCQY